MDEEKVNDDEQLLDDNLDFVLDDNLRQVLVGDYVLLPCYDSIIDRGMVLSIIGSSCEMMILSPTTGIPQSIVIDFRYPNPETELFGQYGYMGIQVCARKGEPAAVDFLKQLLVGCEQLVEEMENFNPYMILQANVRLGYLRMLLD